MRGFVRLLEQFRSDERGVFAIMFGLIAVVLIAMGGATVDFVSLEQTRNRAQAALDAAALALQPEIYNTKTTTAVIKSKAEALLLDRIGSGDVVASVSDIRVDLETGSLFLQAQMTMPTLFVRLVGVEQLNAAISAQATRRKLAMEIVMVLDNSGSMLQQKRMDYLKKAAECATYILMYDEVVDDSADTCKPASGAKLLEDVKIGIVPFTMYVNVGKGNATQPWIDQIGISPLANDNFDNDHNESTPFNGMVNRLALYNGIKNDAWRGCVEARPHVQSGTKSTEFYDTDDYQPVPPNLPHSNGVPDSMFVPLFAPDLAETMVSLGTYNNYTNDKPKSCDVAGICNQVETRNNCNSSMSNCSATITTWKFTDVTGLKPLSNPPPSCECRGTWSSYSSWKQTNSNTGSNRTFERTRSCSPTFIPNGYSQRVFQERLCKYDGATLDYTTGQKGPNADCPYEPILPLTDDPAKVVASIKAMVADGGTNIHEGTAWGYRALSPTPPFAEGAPYGEATNKVLIVMTDGSNTTYQTNNINGSNYHSAYGFPFNQRLGTMASKDADLIREMDQRTLDTCTNAKSQKSNGPGIDIYTIGLSPETPEVKVMLTACASNPTKAQFPLSPNALKGVFQDIARELAALRLDK